MSDYCELCTAIFVPASGGRVQDTTSSAIYFAGVNARLFNTNTGSDSARRAYIGSSYK